MASELKHETVLLNEAVDALVTNEAGIYIDGTYGRGGHTRHALARLSPLARFIAFDKDPLALQSAEQLAASDSRFAIIHDSFATLAAHIETLGLTGQVDGVLLDLGVSSPQLDDAGRGFSFMADGPLDMRMNNQSGQTAAQWLNQADVDEIALVLKEFGEERFAKRIARAIVAARDETPLTTTAQLAALIAKANPSKEKGKHPATRSFQAIRIFINRELDDLALVLEQALQVLKPGGRLVVISFHSLEDRMVKQFIQRKEKGDPVPRHLPIRDDMVKRELKSLGKAVKASADEVLRNVRSRSAIMRVAEKVA
ncbi:16S rRNA (cytosine(1402)-N(4))-methyltransferase RsmH [Ketobacter sp.]|uniref:16S rRNA (cytosine(1402)-N(4))-methyltransferase RsmH n=1 Tax=Ketobacter sp. TaxID=2083498 RepID=UPI000F1A8B3D|nr:16S rRNA (cytosine(1402)-N(4))-methyltransferase RsmH [Ketobacter sp.]RLU00432.1 MAG: 16S rRNA (cytosine(1402)-N(4))-methyltransferase RsmH [Ketobacter sp.]